MLPARRSTPEHDPCMTSEHSTTDRWESILRREETGVPRENPRSQVEIDWNSTDIQQKFGFMKRVDKGWVTTMKDLESWRLER